MTPEDGKTLAEAVKAPTRCMDCGREIVPWRYYCVPCAWKHISED